MSVPQRLDGLISQINQTLSDEKDDTTNKKVYNFGVIGCGHISGDFCNSLDRHPRCRIVACASRSLESARKFAKTYNIETAYNSYESLAQDERVEVVYVGTIHPAHLANVLLCLKAKKHVICEKPIGMNSKEVAAMAACARENKVFLLEAMWTRFFPAIRRIRELIFAEGAIGEIKQVFADFGKNMDSIKLKPRLWDVELGGGALLDLGVYVVAPLMLCFGTQRPETIAAVGGIEGGVDGMMNAIVKYPGGAMANISTGMYSNTPGELHICGTKGRIFVHSPQHCPETFTLVRYGNSDGSDGKTGKREEIGRSEETFKLPSTGSFRCKNFYFGNSEGLYYEVEEVVKCLDAKLMESPSYTHEEMILMHQVCDEIRKQIGVVYPQDKE